MKNYNHKRRSFSSGPHLLGLLFIVVGLVSIVSPAVIEISISLEKSIWVGVGAILLGSMIVSYYEGTLVDFDKKRLKEYVAFMGYKFGQWSDLPNITTIAVIPVQHKVTNTPNGISPTWSGTATNFKVLLYSENSKAVVSLMFSSKGHAIAEAKHLIASLNTNCKLKIAEGIEML